MNEDQELRCLLERYIDGKDTLYETREYAILHLGLEPNWLVDHVSMEIWQYQDGLMDEDELKARLAELLAESREQAALPVE